MRRADRLFQLIQLLRRRNVATAAWLAEELEVSERTVYRDVRDLMLSGVPIEGEAGVGYILRRGFDLPPLMFTEPEIEAMVLGARVVRAGATPASPKPPTKPSPASSPSSRTACASASTAPRSTRPASTSRPHVAAALGDPPRRHRRASQGRTSSTPQRTAAETERAVRPLGLFFWGTSWSLAGWCELRQDFRSFRLDRIRQLTPLDQRFLDEPGRRSTTTSRKSTIEDPE